MHPVSLPANITVSESVQTALGLNRPVTTRDITGCMVRNVGLTASVGAIRNELGRQKKLRGCGGNSIEEVVREFSGTNDDGENSYVISIVDERENDSSRIIL